MKQNKADTPEQQQAAVHAGLELLGTLRLEPSLKATLVQNVTAGTAASGVFYFVYPHAFLPYFDKPTPTGALTTLAVAGYLLYSYIMCVDRVYDDDDRSTGNFFNYWSLQSESLRLMYQLFPPDAEFWSFYSLREEEYVSAIQREALLGEQVDPTAYFEVASGKSAYGKLAIDGLRGLYGQQAQRHAQLLASHDAFSRGTQILDDIQDLRFDIARQHSTYVTNMIVTSAALGTGVGRIPPEKNEEARKYFYASGLASEAYTLAIAQFTEAIELLPAATPSAWLDLIRYFIRKSESARALVEERFTPAVNARP